MLLNGSTLELENSMFELNFSPNKPDDVIGILNLGGEVRCDARSCVPVCTTCSPDDDGGSGDDAATVHSSEPPSALPLGLALTLGFVLMMSVFAIVGIWGRVVMRRRAVRESSEETEFLRVPFLRASDSSSRHGQRAFLASSDEGPSSASQGVAMSSFRDGIMENGKAPEPHISISALCSSPAPIFVVDRTMRITLWSQGRRWEARLRTGSSRSLSDASAWCVCRYGCGGANAGKSGRLASVGPPVCERSRSNPIVRSGRSQNRNGATGSRKDQEYGHAPPSRSKRTGSA